MLYVYIIPHFALLVNLYQLINGKKEYFVLKDADVPDMVRFGMRDIEPKYLRNKTAHKLLPTSQAAVQFLRL